VFDANTLPAAAALYHLILLPEAVKSDTFGLFPVQNVCVAFPVGAEGMAFTVMV
jgi:hypothetical protein